MKPLFAAVVLLAASSVQAAPLKIAVVELAVGKGVPADTAGPLTEAVVAEVRKARGVNVLTQKEFAAVLSLEQQKQLLGCDSDKCRAELGNALGVDRLMMGDLAKLGDSWLLHLKLLDVQKVAVVSQVDRRQRGGTVDDLLDALPAMVNQLLAGELKDEGAPVGAAAIVPVARQRLPSTADVPIPAAEVPKGLSLVTDGTRYIAFLRGELRTLFHGDGKSFYDARVSGGGRSGQEFDAVFWEPRVRERWRGGFEFRAGQYNLQCGETKRTFTPVPDDKAAKIFSSARFFKPRWQRMLHSLARDDLGNYYLVDQSRAAPGKDLRLYVGRKAAMKAVELVEVLSDAEGDLLITPTGRLKITRHPAAIEWLEGQATTKLKVLDVEANAPMAYGELSAYKGEALGTPCDGLVP